ncbi:MAG: CRISPR-associated endonuclease Cas1 [Planctomycetes bacterium]|nr:CRISPR-associated endonuclease Cas1 [Planctomycetota bacterium]
MGSLIITELGTTLAAQGDLFLVKRANVAVRQVRVQDVGQVVLLGPIEITSHAIAGCLRRGIDVVFLTGAGRYRGRLVGPPSRNAPLRLAQFRAAADPAAALGLARGIVRGKVHNQRNLLLRVQRTLRDDSVADALSGMRRLGERIDAAAGLDVLRGLEGQAAALYFGVFGKTLRNPAFSFSVRTRRPPRDPVNACLSFGYTLLGVVTESIVLGAGFDPLIGFFHQPDYGRPSLVLDVIEEFRPLVVDHLVIRLVNRRQLAPEDFEHPAPRDEAVDDPLAVPDDPDEAPAAAPPATGGGEDARAVYLSGSGRRVFLGAFFKRLRETHYYPPRSGTYDFRDIIEQQVYAIARVVEGKAAGYVPFVPR